MKHEKWFWEHCDAHNDDIKRQLLRVKNSTDVIACVEFIHGDTAEHKANARFIAATPKLLAASKDFVAGWNHFLKRIDFGASSFDAKSIRFMNEVPGKIQTAIDAAKPE